jgi:GT2 family glycosyltransferase
MPSAGEPGPARVLLAVLVYNGREFVPRCLESAAGQQGASEHDVDVLVLDDCSPEPGWSDELEELSAKLHIGYYRSPRNLGIPRNMNLGLLRGVAGGYDFVAILNSDLILPANFVPGILKVADANENVGTVTAWSNNASIYSLPNADAERYLASQEWTNWVSAAVANEFGPQGVEIPVGVGNCLLVPTPVVTQVGLFDPVYGRGYCEEVDFCLRCRSAGLRNLLAPNVFVYHKGNASTRLAGLLADGESTVEVHERIVDWRYPLYRSQVGAYLASSIPDTLLRNGLNRILIQAATEFGYAIEAGWLNRSTDDNEVHFVMEPTGRPAQITAYFRGFTIPVGLPAGAGILEGVRELMGGPPRRVAINDRGEHADDLVRAAGEAGLAIVNRVRYPERV